MASKQIQALLLLTVVLSNIKFNTAVFEQPDPQSREQMETSPTCFRRPYTFKVKQDDSLGHSCWDIVTINSCWGRCDSNEIADWRFPFKRSHHPVCKHNAIQPRIVSLKNCDPQVEPGTELYVALDALSCRCEMCRSDVTNCEGPQYDRRIKSTTGTSKKTISANNRYTEE